MLEYLRPGIGGRETATEGIVIVWNVVIDWIVLNSSEIGCRLLVARL